MAFGLAFPFRAGLRAARARPGALAGAVLVLLLPVVPVVAAIVLLLHGAAGTALVGLLAGSPADAPGVVVARPDGAGVRALVALVVLAVVAVVLVLGAGLVAGASDPTRGTIAAVVRRWARIAPALLVAGLLFAAGAAGVVALAVLAGRLRFQLSGVVLVLGLGALAVVGLRLSLAPAVAATHSSSVPEAVRRAWTVTRDEASRLVLAFAGLVLVVAAPVVVLAWLGGLVLDGVARAEVAAVSPLAAGWWAVALVAVGAVVAATLWGLGTRAVAEDVGA